MFNLLSFIIFSIIFVIILIIILIALFFFFNKKFQQLAEGQKSNQGLLLLQNQINELTRAVDVKLTETHKVVQEQYGASAQIIREVTEKLTKLDETNKQVIGFTDQLQNLQDILKNPKQRGVLGEYFLETVLKNVLPPKSYQMQYKLGKDEDGKDLIVDAVVFVKNKLIPIDSKFSLENYNRILGERDLIEKERLEKLFKQDLKTRIDETAKYIKPEQGTMDFAFMFIPSEAIFYDLLVNQIGAIKTNTQDLVEYAFNNKHVIIVSPTSFLAYLQTVLQGLRALEIEESVKGVIKKVGDLGKHLMSYDTYMQKLGNSLSTAVNMYNTAYKEFQKVDKDVVKISASASPNLGGGRKKIEALEIEKPSSE